MKTSSLLLSTILLLAFTACNESNTKTILPSSTGTMDELIVVFNEKDWNSPTGDSLFTHLNQDFPMLIPSERLLNFKHINYQQFDQSFMKRFRSFLFIGYKDGKDPVSGFMQKTIDEKELESFKIGDLEVYTIKNLWSTPQRNLFLLADNHSHLQEIMSDNYHHLLDYYLDNDLHLHFKKTAVSGVNKKLNEQLNKHYNISLKVPSVYKLDENKQGSLVLKRDDTETVVYLMIDVQPINGNAVDLDYVIKRRAELGKDFIYSTRTESSMLSDSTLGFWNNPRKFRGMQGLETRGLWAMNNEFKGGPFVNYTYLDEKNNQIVFLDGMVYAPGKPKRLFMREIEAIFNSLNS